MIEQQLLHLFAQVELRDTVDGQHGFLLPNEDIIPASQEALDGILAMIEEAKIPPDAPKKES